MEFSKTFIKNFDTLSLDFNNTFKILSERNYLSLSKTTDTPKEQIFKNTFAVKNVQDQKIFINLINKIVENYKLTNVKLDADIFISFLQGNAGTVHEDTYDVILYNLHGEVMYLVDQEKFILEQGDILHIKKGQIHQSITLSPRITFSLGLTNLNEA